MAPTVCTQITFYTHETTLLYIVGTSKIVHGYTHFCLLDRTRNGLDYCPERCQVLFYLQLDFQNRPGHTPVWREK